MNSNAINLFNFDTYTGSDLSRVLPIQFKLNNQTSEEKELTVKELLPYGVEGYNWVPVPDEGDDLLWTVTVPGFSGIGISYWLKLPDEIGTYDLVTEVYEGESRIDQVSVSFDVSQIVLSRIDELLVEIDSITASGSDATYLGKVRNHLQALRNRGGDTLTQVNSNLEEAVRACYNLSLVVNTDVSLLRAKAAMLMRVMGRRHYDKVNE